MTYNRRLRGDIISLFVFLELVKRFACLIGAILGPVWITLPKECYRESASMQINSACSSMEKTAFDHKHNMLPTFVEIYTAKGIDTRGRLTQHWRVLRVEH